jgi:hypothetical protein
MNFLSLPKPGLQPNSPMNDDEHTTAIQFIDELVSLGVHEKEPYPGDVVNT